MIPDRDRGSVRPSIAHYTSALRYGGMGMGVVLGVVLDVVCLWEYGGRNW